MKGLQQAQARAEAWHAAYHLHNDVQYFESRWITAKLHKEGTAICTSLLTKFLVGLVLVRSGRMLL